MSIVLYFTDLSNNVLDDMHEYIHDNNLTMVRYEAVDVSDVSGSFDMVYTFEFHDASDASYFKLKYKNND